MASCEELGSLCECYYTDEDQHMCIVCSDGLSLEDDVWSCAECGYNKEDR